jgi:hypothetical protein
LSTPGFLENGIDFEQLVNYYLDNNCSTIVIQHTEFDLAIKLMEYIIGSSYKYKDKDNRPLRFQMIFNSTLQELVIKVCSTLIKRSSGLWTLSGHYEKGTDFISTDNVEIEAKVYKDWDSMLGYAEKGSTDYTVFHGADYVLCYLIDSYEDKHWYWLKKINGIYTIYNDEALDTLTSERLPAVIPVCYCKLSDNKLIIGKNTFCK